MQQKLNFIGPSGMNSDIADELLPSNERRFALNCRILSSNTGNQNALETMNGNVIVPHTFNPGVNTVIGSVEYELDKKNYYFVYNTLGNHSILEYDQVANVINVVLGNSFSNPQLAAMNFQLTNLITGINVIRIDNGKTLLYWTDGWIDPANPDNYNEPKKLNIEKAKAFMQGDYVNGYKFPFDPNNLYRIKTPPLYPPTYTWSGLNQNYPYSFKATNNNTSVTMGVGQPPVLIQFDTAFFNPNGQYNQNNGIWTVATTAFYTVSGQVNVNFGGVGGLPDLYIKNVTTGATLYSGGSTNGTILFSASLSLNAGDKIAVYVSIVASVFNNPVVKGVSFNSIQTGTLSANINNLFKKLILFKVQFVYDDYEVSAWSPISNYVFPNTVAGTPTGEDIILQDNIITINVPTGSSIVTKIRIACKEIGDFVSPQLSAIDFSLIAILNKADLNLHDNAIYQYVFTNEINGVPLEVNESDKLFDNVPLTSQSQELINGTRLTDGLITENFNPVAIDVRLPLTYPIITPNTNAGYPAQSYFKTGTKRQFGIAYYDHANRSGMTNVIDGNSTVLLQNGTYGTTLQIPFITEDTYAPLAAPEAKMQYVPQVGLEIYNKPPAWATHYQIISSTNQTIGRWLQFVAQFVSFVGEDGQPAQPLINGLGNPTTATGILINIGNITGQYKTENPLSTLVYDYVSGDRIRFIGNTTGNTAISIFDFNDTQIYSYDPVAQNLLIKINNNSTLRQLDSSFFAENSVLFEIYNPIPTVINEGELVYEIGECFPIITLPNGDRVHGGDSINQQYYPFYDNISTNVSSPGCVSFLITGILPFNIEDKIKAVSTPPNNNNQNFTYGVIKGIVNLGATQRIETNIKWAQNSPANTGGTLIKAAIITIQGGDSFRLYSNMPWVRDAVNRFYCYIENMNASNMFTSTAYNYGRPNAIDPAIVRITRPSTIRYSEKLIPETFINGLSSVFDENFETYYLPFGGIYKMSYRDSNTENPTLIIYQELKTGAIGVEQQTFTNVQGQDVVGLSPNVLNPQIQYYQANYGIGHHPESFAKYKSAMYGIDVKRRTVWRLSNDGLIPISEYGMFIFWGNLCDQIMSSPTKVNIYGVYDVYFGQYIIAVSAFSYVDNGVTINVPAQTLSFDEANNKWDSFFSYAPENMTNSGVNIITAKNGQIYLHNQNVIFNNFYGVQYPSEVWFMCNANPYEVKILEAMEQVTNSVWEVYEITSPDGQLSNLIESDFETKENLQYAPFLFDQNTPNVANPLIEGDVLRNRTFLLKLRYNPTTYNKLFGININFIESYRHGDDGKRNSPTNVKMA